MGAKPGEVKTQNTRALRRTPASAKSEARLPKVSVVVAVLNEVGNLPQFLESVVAQDYPADLVEVLVVDGGSTDGSLELAEAAVAARPNMRMFHNREKIQSVGFNLGISQSRGDIVALASAHTVLNRSYLSTCVRLLEATGADNVGGGQDAHGVSAFGRAVAAAYGSRFGVGGASHHYSSVAGPADTVFPGCFRRAVFHRVGMFDESLAVHEDYELNWRIRHAGGIVYYSPEIRTPYSVRETPAALARQYFRYGRAKGTVARRSPGVVRPHHLAPPLLVLGLAILAPWGLRSRDPRRGLTALLGAYGGVLALATAEAGKDLRSDARRWLPLALTTMHLTWGAGMIVGLLAPRRVARPQQPKPSR
jgi:succinoglycan biosynthesis protein ExoA